MKPLRHYHKEIPHQHTSLVISKHDFDLVNYLVNQGLIGTMSYSEFVRQAIHEKLLRELTTIPNYLYCVKNTDDPIPFVDNQNLNGSIKFSDGTEVRLK